MIRKHHADVQALAGRALQAGGRLVSAGVVQWDIHGRCESPFRTTYFARPQPKWIPTKGHDRTIIVGPGTPVPMEVIIHTPCNKCDSCRSYRARLWAARAKDETRLSERTWFGTLTLRPEARFLFDTRARAKCFNSGVDFDALPEKEQLALIHAAVSGEITKMVKRLRRALPAGALRYVCVLERHKDGALHYHVLLHERYAQHAIRHKTLAAEWPHGFTKWKLVDKEQAPEKAAWYVSKYLAKSALARVRASEHYGRM